MPRINQSDAALLCSVIEKMQLRDTTYIWFKTGQSHQTGIAGLAAVISHVTA